MGWRGSVSFQGCCVIPAAFSPGEWLWDALLESTAVAGGKGGVFSEGGWFPDHLDQD